MTRRAAVVSIALAFALALGTTASALTVRVTMPNGDRLTGEWLGSSESTMSIRLGDGQTLEMSLDGVVAAFGDDDASISIEARARLDAALDAVALGMDTPAESAFRDSIALAPRFARAYYEYARFLEHHGRASEAFQHYVLAARLDAKTYRIADKIRAAADDALGRKDFTSAGRALLQFAQSFSNDATAPSAAYDAARYLADGADASEPGDAVRADAERALRYATTTYPDHAACDEARLRLANLYLTWKQPTQAAEVAEDFIRRRPNSPRIVDMHLALGYAHLQRRELARVIEEARWVLQRAEDPDMQERARTLAAESAWVVQSVDAGLSAASVFSVLRDGRFLWVGSSGGVGKYDASGDNLTSAPGAPEGTAGMTIRAIAADDSEVWLATANKGVVRYRRDNGNTAIYGRLDGLPSHSIAAVAMDANEVWVGGTGGLSRLNRVTGEWTPFRSGKEFPGQEVTAIALSPSHVWVGTQGNGVLRLTRATSQWESFGVQTGLGSNSIRSMVLTPTGIVAAWSTSDKNGLSEWSESTRQWANQPIGPDEIAPHDIRVTANSGTLWVAVGEALLYKDARGKWGSVDYPSALRSARIYTALADSSSVWVGTSAGLGRLDIRATGTLGSLR